MPVEGAVPAERSDSRYSVGCTFTLNAVREGVVADDIVHLEFPLLIGGVSVRVVVRDYIGGNLDTGTIIIHSDTGVGQIDYDRVLEKRCRLSELFQWRLRC